MVSAAAVAAKAAVLAPGISNQSSTHPSSVADCAIAAAADGPIPKAT